MRSISDSPTDDLPHRFEQMYAQSGLSHGQIQILTGQLLDLESPLYNMAFGFVIEGDLDLKRFCLAWQTVVDSSDALRTSLDLSQTLPRKVISGSGACALKTLDFSIESSPEKVFRAWTKARCAKALPLDGDLVESVVVSLGGGRWGWYLNQHHLITDAFSTVLLYQHVSAEYAKLFGEGEGASALPEYYNIVELGSRERAEDDSNNLPHGVSTPFYGEPSVPTTTKSVRRTIELSAEQSEQIRALAMSPGFASFTADMSQFAVFASLLTAWMHHLGGKDELGFDAPALTRTTPETKESLGLFIELFPFLVSIENTMSFRGLGERCLAETMRFLSSAQPGKSAPSGGEGNNVVLNFFTGSFGDFAGMPMESEWVHSGHADRVHALRLQIKDYDGTGRFTLHFDFNEKVFSVAQQQRAMSQFGRLLGVVLADPDVVLGEIDVFSPEEREELLVGFNQEAEHAKSTQSVVELFLAQVSRTPDAIALSEGDENVSFRELQNQVESLAGRLIERGVTPGDPVAVYMRRSSEAVIAILAVLRARAFYIPMDPGNPTSRSKHIVQDSCAKLVLVREGDECAGESLGAPCFSVGKNSSSECVADLPELPSVDDAAYMIYTSGSTGLPKGVRICHGGLADYVEWAERNYVRGEQLVFPLFTSLSFDLTVTTLYLPLISGGTMVVYGEDEGPVDFSVMKVVKENRADFIKLTPSHLSLLRQMDLTSSRLSRMVVGGEDFKTHLAAAISSQFDDRIEIYNEYGPTEAVVGCMIHRYDPVLDRDASVPIGRPADHVQLYVLNESRQLVPEGAVGELAIARYGLAEGYHQRPDLTEQVFVDHPFQEGEKIYLTGDLVRFSRPGCLDYLGRADRQLKVSGHRIEAGEIEAAMLSYPAVKNCVIAVQDQVVEVSPEEVRYCVRCGLASDYPEASYDEEGVCSVCRSYEEVKERTGNYFGTPEDLKNILSQSAGRKKGEYDCMVLLSGGKDSTYALCQVVEMGFKVYAFSLDNGYISEGAIQNIQRVVKTLGVDHEFATTSAMNAIFRDSLTRFSNVCNGCFKTIYTLSINRAREMGIPTIVTGLSRGQFFETRLTEQMFQNGRCNPQEIDRAVLAARKAYHRFDDEVNRSLDVSGFEDDEIFEEVEYVDFYRYCEASLSEMLGYLSEKAPWVRPADTGRSTNCLVNDVGIYIHRKERRFHNYALPYSWDVRMGHKTREEALDELNDELDLKRVREMLAEIGYDEDRLSGKDAAADLVAYYLAEEDISEAQLAEHLSKYLPSAVVPKFFQRIDVVPLAPSGKVDMDALPRVDRTDVPTVMVAPEGPVQERVAEVWSDILHLEEVDASKTFFELGGTSLAAMEVMLRLCQEFELDLPLQTAFQHPTVSGLADVIEAQIFEEIESMSDEEAELLAKKAASES